VQPDVPVPAEVVWRRPSPRLWQARQAVLGGATGVVVLALVVAVVAGADVAAVVTSVAVTVLVAVAVWIGLRGRYRSWGYAERADDLLVRRGLMVRRLSVVPYGRMQFVDVTAGPVDRMFGLATVQLHTAAAATDARIPGLAAEDAQRLRDRLAALGEARAAGL
jgi:membrane protein YdbS with pleckstrin-like domain